MERSGHVHVQMTGGRGGGKKQGRTIHPESHTRNQQQTQQQGEHRTIRSTRTRAQHKRAPKRCQQEGIPPLHISLIRQPDPFLQRIRQHRHDQVLQQDIGEDTHADDEDGESFRGAEGAEGHLGLERRGEERVLRSFFSIVEGGERRGCGSMCKRMRDKGGGA